MNLWKAQFVRARTDGSQSEDFVQFQFNATNLDGALIRANELQPTGFTLSALWRD